MDHNLIAFPVTPKRRKGEPAPDERQPTGSIRTLTIAGIALCAGLLAGTGGWLLLAAMSWDGGRTTSEGTYGDPASLSAELSLIVQEINDLSVRKARLVAERDASETIRLSGTMKQQLTDDGGLLLLSSQDALLRNRRQARLHQETLMRRRIAGIRNEIAAMKQQQRGIALQLQLAAGDGRQPADRKSLELVGFDKAVPKERHAAKLQESHGQIVAEIARAHGRITAVELQILRLDMRFRESVLSELALVRDKLSADLSTAPSLMTTPSLDPSSYSRAEPVAPNQTIANGIASRRSVLRREIGQGASSNTPMKNATAPTRCRIVADVLVCQKINESIADSLLAVGNHCG